MIKNKLKLIKPLLLSILIVLVLTGCFGYVGGTCEYDTISSYAVVKEINEDDMLLSIPHSNPFRSSNRDEIKTAIKLMVKVGDKLPIKISTLTRGSCAPKGSFGYYIDRKDLPFINGFGVGFTSEGIIYKNAEMVISKIASHFLSLQKDYPSAKLNLYAYADKNHSREYSYSLAQRYGNKVKESLIEKGIDNQSIYLMVSSEETYVKSSKVQLENRVLFSVNLN